MTNLLQKQPSRYSIYFMSNPLRFFGGGVALLMPLFWWLAGVTNLCVVLALLLLSARSKMEAIHPPALHGGEGVPEQFLHNSQSQPNVTAPRPKRLFFASLLMTQMISLAFAQYGYSLQPSHLGFLL